MAVRSRRAVLSRILLICALCSPFLFFSARLSFGSAGLIGRFIQEVVYPVEYTFFGLGSSLKDFWNNYVDLTRAARENQELHRQLYLMKTRTLDYEEMKLEVERLRLLYEFRRQQDSVLTVGEVISVTDDRHFESLRINRGSLDGLKIGLPVLSSNGVVGKVIRVGFRYADIQLLTDVNFSIDALVQRTRVRGVLRGQSAGQMILDLHSQAEVKIGDTMITSGIVGSFPKGIPIGRVVKISYDADRVSQRMIIEPWIDSTTLEEVLVLERMDREVSKIAESTGADWIEETIRSVGRPL